MYQPSDDLLKKYAHIFINFALGQEKGIRPEETVFIAVPECARPMLTHLHNAVLEAGGHPVVEIIPDDLRKEFFARANDEQIAYQPMNRLMGQIKDMDHRMYIIAEADKYELAGVDPKKILARAKSVEEYRKALFKKDDDGELTWTLGMYGTQAMADDVGLSLEEYWQQIIDACFLEEDDPIAKWKEVYAEMYDFRDKLNALRIESVHVQ